MNDDFTGFPGAETPAVPPREEHTLGASTIFKLCDEVIRLREMNNRKHQDFDRTLVKLRDELKGGFDNFAAATQKAYQDLRKETVGEKKFSMDLLMLLLEICQDLEHIMEMAPPPDDAEAIKGWMEGVAVETRKVRAAIAQKNILECEARPGEPYNPAMHKRVGSERVEGMGPLLIARTVKKGYASQQPDFVLQRPEVVVSE
jgi:molecular chaperone GrpE (heat shock protein)